MLYGTPDNALREDETAAAAPLPASSMGERWSSAIEAQQKAYNLNSALATKEAEFDKTIDGLFELTGQRFDNPMRAAWIEVVDGVRVPRRSDPVLAFEQRIDELAAQQPDKSREILAFRGSLQRAYEARNAAVARDADVVERSQYKINLPLLGPVDPVSMAGGMWGSLSDPTTLIVNAIGSAGTGARLGYHFLRAGLINAGAEVAQQPFIKQWANEAGDPYGWDQAARSVVASALLGGALDTAVRGSARGIQRARGLEPVRKDGLITGWRSPAEKDAALDAAATRLPADNPVRRAAEGDVAAVREIAEATGAIDDPALRGAIMTREMADGLEGPPAMAVDYGEGFRSLLQSVRNATDPDEPPPARLASLSRSLDMSQDARFARAREMGFDTTQVWYHGTSHGGFDEFTVDAARSAATNNGFGAISVAPMAHTANQFAGSGVWTDVKLKDRQPLLSRLGVRSPAYEKTTKGYDAAVYPLYIRVSRPFVWELDDFHNADGGDTWRRALEIMPTLTRESDFLVEQRSAFSRAVQDAGYDAIDVTSGGQIYERSIFDTANIRSVNAAFDPASKDSPRLLASLAPEQRRAQGAELVAGTDQAPVHRTLLGSRDAAEAAPGGRLDDVAGAEGAAQVKSLERDLASRIEAASKPEKRDALRQTLAQVRREPSRPAKSLGDSLSGVSIDAPAELFRWLGVRPYRFQANYEAIAKKRGAKPSPGADLSDPVEVRRLVEDVLTRGEIALRVQGEDKHWDIVARNGTDDVAGVRLEAKGGRYNVATALVYEPGQLARRLSAVVREHGVDGLKWRDAEAASTILELIRRDVALREHPSAQSVIAALERSQDDLADLEIAAGRYFHTAAATERMAEIRSEIGRTVKMLPSDVQLRVQDELIDFGHGRVAQGAWDGYDRIVYVSLAAADPVRTMRHETVHALRQSGLMTDREFDTLYQFAESAGLRKAYAIDENYSDLYGKIFADRGDAGVEALLREETIADMFADYSLNGRRFADEFGPRGRTIDKILDAIVTFLKTVREALHIRGFDDVRDVFEAIESGAMAQRQAGRVALPGGAEIEGFHLFALKAFHGTPHAFEPEPGAPAGRFRADKIGTGEGAQAYGHGLYFAESEGVARSYQTGLPYKKLRDDFRQALPDNAEFEELNELVGTGHFTPYQDRVLKALAADDWLGFDYPSQSISAAFSGRLADWDPSPELVDAINSAGRLYEVSIKAEPEQFLDWDKPLADQSEMVRKAILPIAKSAAEKELKRRAWNDQMNDRNMRETWGKEPAPRPPQPTADDLALRMHGNEIGPGNEAALREAGIPGIRYLDGSSRGAGQGTSNFVIFPGNEHLIEIVAVDGKPVVSLAQDLADAKRDVGLGKLVEACRL